MLFLHTHNFAPHKRPSCCFIVAQSETRKDEFFSLFLWSFFFNFFFRWGRRYKKKEYKTKLLWYVGHDSVNAREKGRELCYTGYTHTQVALRLCEHLLIRPSFFGPTCPHKSLFTHFPPYNIHPIHLKKDDFRILVNGFSVLFDWGKRNNCESWERKYESVEFELIDWGRKRKC